MSLPDRDTIPGYSIVRELGRGGMATVYLAMQESLGREVALKLLAPRLAEDPVAAERFTREARTAARLVHRHIVGIHDVGMHAGQPYLSMEFLPGDTIAQAPLAPAEALQIVREIALALDHAHRQGVVHRDIKPENILRRADGSCALADFGIARTTDAGVGMTQEGTTLGTPNYMSPEQLQGKELDGRADLYSLGVVLYQLLTGELPYVGTDAWNVGLQHISAPRPSLPEPFTRFQPLIDALMAKDPADRPQTGADAARMIEAMLASTTPAPTRVHRSITGENATRMAPVHGPGRQRLVPSVAGLAVVALLAWGAWSWWSGRAPADPPAARAAIAVAPVVEPRSIAVLPLVNLSRNPDNEYFSDGLAGTMLDMLARVPDLTVIARTSSFAFKDKAMDVREIGKSLDATHLLEGSVQQAGDQLRITVQLVRASDGARLWSQRYDRPLTDVFKVQDEVAAEVVRALEVALPAAARKQLRAGGTENIAAYQEYLKGMALLPLRRIDGLRAALGHFEEAIRLDPLYAQAYAGAANTLILLRSHQGLTSEQIAYRAELIKKALQLDPSLGEAYIARAGILQGVDQVAAERDFKRGLELAPNYANGLQWYAEFLSYDLGRPMEAVAVMERAVALDPLAPMIRSELANAHLQLGQVEAAQRIADHLLRQHPDFAFTYGLLGKLADLRGDLVASLQASGRRIATDPASVRSRGERCSTLLSFGALQPTRDCIARLPGEGLDSRWRNDMQLGLALNSADLEAVRRILAVIRQPVPWQIALAARLNGKPDEAVTVLRASLPQWFEQPLRNPAWNSLYDHIDVASALLATGQTAQANEVLRTGMKVTAAAPRSGNWTEVIALSLLGETARACVRMEQAAASGEFLGLLQLTSDPDLKTLREQPCFAPAYAKLKALSDRQIALATEAGLIPPPAPARLKKPAAAPAKIAAPIAAADPAIPEPEAAALEGGAESSAAEPTSAARTLPPAIKRPLKRFLRSRD